MEPKLLPLAYPIGARYDSLTVDARLINCFAEKSADGSEVWVYKRPGFGLQSTLPAGIGRGIYNWNDDIYIIIGDTIYKNGVALLGTVSPNGYYTFSSCLGANPVLFFHNALVAYTVDAAGVLNLVVDANYPVTTVPGSVYIDGTTYVMEPTTAQIDGSTAAGNDPSTWDPLNRILAQLEPNFAIAIAKQLIYLVAIKQYYTEVFYDAGNATGSPLAPVSGAKINYGCLDARTVCSCGGDLMWVGRTREGEVSVVLMTALAVKPVSSPREERIIAAADFSGDVYSWSVKTGGHRLYGLTVRNSNLTLVYDITSGLWYRWYSPTGGYLPYSFATVDATGQFALFLHETNGTTHILKLMNLTDGGSPFQVDIYTPNFEGGTYRSKTLARLDLLGDQVNTLVGLEMSDDDYQTWGPTILFDMNQPRPSAADLGEFYKRAFHFWHKDSTHFRVKMVEAYLDLGTS